MLRRLLILLSLFCLSAQVWANDTTYCTPISKPTKHRNFIVRGILRQKVPVMQIHNPWQQLNFRVDLRNDTTNYLLGDTLDFELTAHCQHVEKRRGHGTRTTHFHQGKISNRRSIPLPASLSINQKEVKSKHTLLTVSGVGKIIPNPKSIQVNKGHRLSNGPLLFVSGANAQDTLPIIDRHFHQMPGKAEVQLIGFEDEIEITNMVIVERQFAHRYIDFTNTTRVEILKQSPHYTQFQKTVLNYSLCDLRGVSPLVIDSLTSEEYLVVGKYKESAYREHYLLQSLYNNVTFAFRNLNPKQELLPGEVIQVKVPQYRYKPSPYSTILIHQGFAVQTGKKLPLLNNLICLDTVQGSLEQYHNRVVYSNKAVYAGLPYSGEQGTCFIKAGGYDFKLTDWQKHPFEIECALGDKLAVYGQLLAPENPLYSPYFISTDFDSTQITKSLFKPSESISSFIASAAQEYQTQDVLLQGNNYDLVFYNYGLGVPSAEGQILPIKKDSVELHEEVFHQIEGVVIRLSSHKQSDQYKLYYSLHETINALNTSGQDPVMHEVHSPYVEIPAAYWNTFRIPKRKHWPFFDQSTLAMGDTLVDSGGEMGFIADLVFQGKVAYYNLPSMTLKIVRFNQAGTKEEEQFLTIVFSYGC